MSRTKSQTDLFETEQPSDNDMPDAEDLAPQMAVETPPKIDDGQSLMIREGGAQNRSLMDSISLFYYRMTWRTPLRHMSLKGKTEARLRAVPKDPVPGNKVRGTSIRAGQFLFRGHKKQIDTTDFANLRLPPDYENYIHRFRWLRDLSAVTGREQGRLTAEHLVLKWLDANGRKSKNAAWRPDNCGWRLLFWASYAPYILTSEDAVYRANVLGHLSQTARHLDKNARKAPAGLPKLVAWTGVVVASLLLPDGKARRVVGEAGLADAIYEFFFADGGSVTRSPLAQLDAIAILAMLKQAYEACKEDLPLVFQDVLDRAVPAVLALTHSDGGLGSWQGSAAIPAEHVQAVVESSGVRARPLRQARDWGYQRVVAGRSVLLLDGAPPPTAKLAMSGCASTLAFEFSSGAHRIIVNCGGAAMVGAQLPAALARGLRTTAAHSTLCIEDTNSTAILPQGKLGLGVTDFELSRRDVEKATRIEASHDGYMRSFGLTHKRILLIRADGHEIRGEDMLLPGPKKMKKGGVKYALAFHLGLNIEANIVGDGHAVILRLEDGSVWQFRSASLPVSLDESVWVDGQGRPHQTQQILIAGAADKGGATASWILKNMG